MSDPLMKSRKQVMRSILSDIVMLILLTENVNVFLGIVVEKSIKAVEKQAFIHGSIDLYHGPS